MKTWKFLLLFLGLLPWTFTISLLAFFFHAGNILGHAPSYGNPDPKELAIYSDYEPFIHISATAWLYSFLLWLSIVILYLVSNKKTIRWPFVMVGIISQFFAVCMLFSGIFEWYVD